MTDPLSLVGAIVGLAGLASAVSKELARCIRTMRLAKWEVTSIQIELSTFGVLLRTFSRMIWTKGSPGQRLEKETGLGEGAYDRGILVIRRMEALLKYVGLLGAGKAQVGWQHRLAAQFRWYLKKKEALELCIHFNEVKTSVTAVVSFITFRSVNEELEKLKEEIRKLREEHPEAQERITQLEEHRKQMQKDLKGLKVEVEAAQEACTSASMRAQQQQTIPGEEKSTKKLERSVQRVSAIINEQFELPPQPRRQMRRSRAGSTQPVSRGGRHPSRRPTGPTERFRPPKVTTTAPDSSFGSTGAVILQGRSGGDAAAPPPSGPVPDTSPKAGNGPGAAFTRPPRYFRDFRNTPFPDRNELSEGPSLDHDDSQGLEGAKDSGPQSPENGPYVNPEDPQDRRPKPPSGRPSYK